jgi:hypothetical protein
LAGLLGAVGAPAEAKAWQAVQTDSLKAFGSYSFSAGMMDLEGLLLQLDTITSQQALVQMMVGGGWFLRAETCCIPGRSTGCCLLLHQLCR